MTLYKEVSPVLISRFGDREETVRLEVWATYVLLLNQTGVYGGLPQANVTDSNIGAKRKRENDENGMDIEENPYTILRSQLPSLAKALLNQLKSPKTAPSTLQAGFGVLHALLSVLPGSLSGQAVQILTTSKSVLSQPPTTSTSALHTTCLSFLALFFSTHSPPTFVGPVASLQPALLSALGERHPRVASEAFRVYSSLLNAMKPVKSSDWVDSVYTETLRRLKSADTDAEVRARAEECMGDLWVCATDTLRTKDGKEWDSICRTIGRTEGAVKVITRVSREVEISDDWVNGCVEWLLGLLKKSGRGGKVDVFIALDVLLNR